MDRRGLENDLMKKRYRFVTQKFKSYRGGVITPEIASKAVMPRRADIHKGDCGRLLIWAGSPGLTGAAVMASQSALKSGAGLISLICAKELNTIFEIRLTEVMTVPLEGKNGIVTFDQYEKIKEHMQKSDAFLIGPGLSQTDGIRDILKKIIRDSETALIIDADGINIISKNINILSEAHCPVIMTPHIGEFARLCGRDTEYVMQNRDRLGLDFAKKHNVFLTVKSHETTVYSPDGKNLKNILGNPGMATGGSGDVLAGITASLAAQGNDPYTALCSAVFLHSAAADMAELEYGAYSLTPTDIINTLPYAIKETSENNF